MRQFFIIFGLLLFVSCEDVVEVDLNDSEPRLVVDGSINWIKGTMGNDQNITLSLTTPFFSNTINPVTNAIVIVSDDFDNSWEFVQNQTPGIYETNTFEPVLNRAYKLSILYDNQTYEASTTLEPVIEIDFIEQTANGGLSGEDIEIKPNYTDPENERNFYFYSFDSQFSVFPILEVYEDEFTDGNQVFAYYSEEELEQGDIVKIKSIGITESFYNFMFILLSQTNSEVGGPFETQPATLRGNVINTTNQDNFPLGYFRASEIDEILYTVE